MQDSKLRITDVEVLNLRAEYPPELRFRYSGGICTGRITSLVRVSTEGGLVGWGTVYSHPKLIRVILEEHLKPFLLGEDALEIDRLWGMMYTLTRWYGQKGVAISALGAVDIALWDLKGKALGKPVSELLGAGQRSVPAYASGLLWKEDVQDLEIEARDHMEAGFQGVKMRLGRGQAYDLAALEAVRRGVGSHGDVMVDGSQRYSMETAIWLSPHLVEKGVVYFQEPFPPEEMDNYVMLRRKTQIPLAAGENEFGVRGFQEWVRAEALDILQPDVCRSGGITEVLRIGQMAAEVEIPIITHTWSDALAIIANAHVVAALPNGKMVEVDQTGNPFVEELLIEPLDIHNGQLHLSDTPGLGVEPNLECIEKYSFPPGQAMPDGLYSDLIFGPDYRITPPLYEMDSEGDSNSE